MRVLARKLRRDLWSSKARNITIAISIGLAVGMYAGMHGIWYNIDSSVQDKFEELNYEDISFEFAEPVNQADIDAFAASQSSIKQWDTRISEIVPATIGGETYNARVFGIPTLREPRVNNIETVDNKGRLFSSSDLDQQVALAERRFAENNDLDCQTSFDFVVGQTTVSFEVIGHIFTPESIYSVDPQTGFPDMENLFLVWIPLSTMQDMLNWNAQINEFMVLTENELTDVELEKMRSALEAATGTRVTATRGLMELDYLMYEADSGSLDEFAQIIGVLVMLAVAFIIWDSMSKVVQSERKLIGVMRALGGSRNRIAFHYLSYVLALTALGVLIGIPIGALLSSSGKAFYAAMLDIDFVSSSIYWAPFVPAAAMAFAFAIVAALSSVWSVSKITPREAMSSGFVTKIFVKPPIIERLLSRTRGYARSIANRIPIRNLFRNKTKTLVTALTYALTLMICMAAFGLVETLTYNIEGHFEDNINHDGQVVFLEPMTATDAQAFFTGQDCIDDFELSLAFDVQLSGSKDTLACPVTAVQTDSMMRVFDFKDGDFGDARDGIAVGWVIANQAGVGIGDEIDVLGEKVKITGLLGELMDLDAFMLLGAAQQLLNMPDMVNSALVDFDGDPDEAKVALYDSAQVATVIVNDETKEGILKLMEAIIGIIAFFAIASLVALVFISYNTVMLDLLERKMEFVNLRTLGASGRTLFGVIARQAAFVSILGIILSIPLSYAALYLMYMEMFDDFMTVDLYISSTTFVTGFVIGLTASFFATWQGYRRMSKMSLAQATREGLTS